VNVQPSPWFASGKFPQIVAQIGKFQGAVERATRKLHESGYLQRICPDKGGYWQVLNENDKEPH
jgi:hypothetical protein